MQKADLALYQAKKCGGGQVAAFDPRLAIKQNRFVEIESELRASLKDNGLDMLFQPIVDLESDAIVGAEALLRLKRDDRLWCQPAEFIPIAEATGLIDEIGIWVLNHAAHGLIELHKKHKNIYISVNLSPQQFSNPLLLKTLREICHLPNFEPSMLKLEITESILAPNNKALRKMMKEISALGFSFSIDDFGTAFSNLAALHRYPISCIKIDKPAVDLSGDRTAGIVLTAKNCKTVLTGNYIDNCWVELSDEHSNQTDASPTTKPFGTLSMTGNIFIGCVVLGRYQPDRGYRRG